MEGRGFICFFFENVGGQTMCVGKREDMAKIYCLHYLGGDGELLNIDKGCLTVKIQGKTSDSKINCCSLRGGKFIKH